MTGKKLHAIFVAILAAGVLALLLYLAPDLKWRWEQ